MSTLLESYGPIFFSAVQNRFHCCSFLLFKLPAALGELTRTPDCPHSLTLKPCEHLAGTVLVPSQQQLSHKLLSLRRGDKGTPCPGGMACPADPGNSQTCSQATQGSSVNSVLRDTNSSPGQLLPQHLAIVILD